MGRSSRPAARATDARRGALLYYYDDIKKSAPPGARW